MTGQSIAQALHALSPPELGGLWRALHNQGQMGALVPVENELIRRAHALVAAHKGGPGSGYRGHAGRPGRIGGSAPRGAAGAEGEPGNGKARYADRPDDDKIERWKREIENWEGGRRGMATTAIRTIEMERMASLVIEAEGELKAITCLTVPRTRHSIFGDVPPTNKIAGLLYAATKERGYGLKMMTGVMQKVASEGWQLSFNATDESLGFYRAIGLTPVREGTKMFFIEAEEAAAWVNSLPKS